METKSKIKTSKRNNSVRKAFNVIIFAAVGIAITLIVMLFQVSGVGVENTPKIVFEKHIQVACPENELLFWKDFKRGAQEAGNLLATYVEFVPIMQRDADDLEKKVEMANYAGVDGIAVQAVDIRRSSEIIQQAKKAGLDVITYESGTFAIPEVPTVGSNYFETGVKAGELATDATDGSTHAIVVLNKLIQDSDLQKQSTLVQGIIEGGKEEAGFEMMDVITIDSTVFDSEQFSKKLSEYVDTANVIICLDEKSTPAIAQILVDEEYVGDMKMVGYGAMPQTLEYIKRGVIFGCVLPDAYAIGYETVTQLVGVMDGEQVSDCINPLSDKVDQSNLDDFMQGES